MYKNFEEKGIVRNISQYLTMSCNCININITDKIVNK